MAENTKEKRTFKWGDREYLLDDLLSMHAAQENNYYDFAKTRGLYDDNALQKLRQAITNRINAIKSGESFDADGVLSTDTADNTKIQTQKKGLFRKEKYVDQDNTEWAKYYLNKLVSNLKPYEKQEIADNGSWDISKHGLSAYLTGQGLNARDIFEKYDLRDKDNPEAARSFTQRREILKKHLSDYNNWLKGKGFDFSKNDNEWDDTFGTDLDKFVIDYDNLDNNTLAALLRRFGAGDDYTTAFTSDKWDLSETSADAKKVKADKERKELVKAYNDAVAGHYGIYEALAPKTAQMAAYMGLAGSNFFRTPEEMLEWSRNTLGVDMNTYQQRYNTNKWDAEAAQYILPLLQSNGRLQKTTIDGTEYVYDPASIDRQNYSFIAIDPITGTMELKFLYDIEHEGAKLRNKYLKPQGAARYLLEALPFKEGGIISMLTGGNFDAMAYLKLLDNQDYKQRAAANGVSERELRESERTPLGKETVINNSDFTGNDLVQLVTMGVNLGSMFLDPLSGAAVGAGASTVDFINDINRDGFQGRDAWNYVKNLGMDALGVLPVIGDTFGTLGKVKKGLFQLAPKIIGYLGMALGVANSPQIIDSFTKILDEREMTTADWQNIASGINLIVSGTRMGKHAIKDARAKKASLQQDQLLVEVTDKAGNSKLLVLDGDNAKAVRDSDHSVEAVDKIVKNIEGMLDYTVNPKSGLFDFSLRMPGKMVKDPTTGDEKRSWNPLEAKTLKANVQAVYDPVAYARAYRGKNPTNTPYSPNERKTLSEQVILRGNKNQIDASGKLNLDQFKTNQLKRVDSYIAGLKKKAKAHGEAKAKNDKDINIVDSTTRRANKIGDAYNKQETTNNDIIAKNNLLLTEINTIKSARQKLLILQLDLDNLKKSSSPTKTEDIKKKIKEIKKLTKLIELQQKNVDDLKTKTGSKNTSIAQKAVNDATNSNSNLTILRTKLQNLLNNLGNQRTALASNFTTNSKEFNKLLNFRQREVEFNGVKYKFGPEGFKKDDLIAEGLFKKGGSINRNKINKFLNYAKG